MKFRQLEVFHAIMMTGSVTKAAEHLGVSQPTVSAIIKNFEDVLNLKLFVRRSGRLVPTPVAEAIYGEVSDIVERLNNVQDTLRTHALGATETLRVAAPSQIAQSTLNDTVSDFMSRHPRARIDLQTLTSPEVIARLHNHRIDLGISYELPAVEGIASELFSTAVLHCIVQRDHAVADRQSVSLQELSLWPIVTYVPETSLRRRINALADQAGVELNVRGQVTSSISGISMARATGCVALVEAMSKGIVDDMVAIRIEPAISVSTYLLWPAGKKAGWLTQEFLRHLRLKTQPSYVAVAPHHRQRSDQGPN